MYRTSSAQLFLSRFPIPLVSSGGEQRQLYFCQHHSAVRKNVRKSKKKRKKKLLAKKEKQILEKINLLNPPSITTYGDKKKDKLTDKEIVIQVSKIKGIINQLKAKLIPRHDLLL
jgi:hypothetical protein